MEETGAGVYPLERILRFSGQSIHLDKSTSKDEDPEYPICFSHEEYTVDILLSEVVYA